jgi:quercetin dioxygenase-like cupin family protein
MNRPCARAALAAGAGAAIVAGAALLACGPAQSAPSAGQWHGGAAGIPGAAPRGPVHGTPTQGNADGSTEAAPQAGAEPSGPGPRDAMRGSPPSNNETLAAIQKAMNELDKAAQQCWAVAATERFDIAGEIALQIDIAAPPAPASASVVRDTAHSARLSACLVQLMAGYRWAPPLYGQAIQLPFRFRAPDGQNTIDRALVAWNGQGNGQGRVSVAVLLDEASTGSAAASMFELAVAAGATTGLRRAERAELWYFLAAGRIGSPDGDHPVGAGDMMYVPRGGAREVAATAGDLHAMVVIVPGGREGAARAGALPTPVLTPGGPRPRSPVILPASAATTEGPTKRYAGATQIPDRTLAASIMTVPAGGRLAEHVHAGEAELLYVLAGEGTLTVDGIALPVTATSVVQIPKNTRHAFMATSAFRAVQIFTPAGSEQRVEVHP